MSLHWGETGVRQSSASHLWRAWLGGTGVKEGRAHVTASERPGTLAQAGRHFPAGQTWARGCPFSCLSSFISKINIPHRMAEDGKRL